MKVISDERTVVSSGLGRGTQFGISEPDQAHIISLLRDQIYSDKVMAVLREYGANARDANIQAGRGDLPIEVTLPTPEDPTFRIRDRGPGLSRDDVMNVYTQYGASSKRDSDEYVGMLGIGSKSAFAYADTFTITSFHGGVRSSYVALIDESQKGTINLLHEELLESDDDTGLEVSISVRQNDIKEFTDKAKQLYRHFTPTPVINTDLPTFGPNDIRLPNGVIAEGYDPGTYNHVWWAVMGCIPYRINMAQVVGVPTFTRHTSGYLYVQVGDVNVAASREELKYSDRTKKAIEAAFDELSAQYAKWALAAVSDPNMSNWERRKRIMGFSRMGLPVPAQHKALSQTYIEFPRNMGDIFSMRNVNYDKLSSHDTTSMHVSKDTRVLVKDDKRTVRGYTSLQTTDYVIIPKKDVTSGAASRALNKTLEDLMLDGMPVIFMSTLPWQPVTSHRNSQQRHGSKRSFTLASGQFYAPYSQCWAPVDRKERMDDVYANIEHFADHFLFENYQPDVFACKMLGENMPAIYGYKKKAGVSEKHLGTEYRAWSLKLNERIVASPVVKKKMEQFSLYRMFQIDDWDHDKANVPDLPDGHPMKVLFEEIVAANDGITAADRTALFALEKRFPVIRDTVKKRVETIMRDYPLLFSEPRKLMLKNTGEVKLYVDYIKLVDSVREKNAGTSVCDNERPDHHLVGGEDQDGEVGRSELSPAA